MVTNIICISALIICVSLAAWATVEAWDCLWWG